jgi:tetratricopeptide (TPR) repeat protein
VLLARRATAPSVQPSQEATPGKLDALARQIVATEVEIARAKLAGGDHEEAVRRAERALKFDPTDPAALAVSREARQIKARVDQAVVGARAAAKNPGTDAAAAALWALLEAAPDHPAAGDLVPGLDASFRPRAEEAERLMATARQAAEKAQANRTPVFEEGNALARSGDAALRKRLFAQSAREFMRARQRFERAQRTVR